MTGVLPPAGMDGHVGAYYLRLMVTDQPGVIAAVATALGDNGVSIELTFPGGESTEDDA